jgi:hypothetical protein
MRPFRPGSKLDERHDKLDERPDVFGVKSITDRACMPRLMSGTAQHSTLIAARPVVLVGRIQGNDIVLTGR